MSNRFKSTGNTVDHTVTKNIMGLYSKASKEHFASVLLYEERPSTVEAFVFGEVTMILRSVVGGFQTVEAVKWSRMNK